MVKVLHVISDTGIGGAGIHLCNLLSCIDRNFFETSVCLPQNSLLAPRIRELGYPVIEIKHGNDRSADLRAIPEMIDILRRQKPHILHTHSALYARLAGGICRIPISVNTRHCANENENISHLRRFGSGCLERMSGSHTIATADYVKSELIREGLTPENISVIHNGSRPISRLTYSETAKIRQTIGLSRNEFAVGMVARLEEGKGHETFLNAAALCTRINPHIRFLVVGSGSLAFPLRSLACQLGLGDRIIFTGFQANVIPIMNILHLNVNCSEHSETSSLSLSEGMSVGAVPVVSHCGGNPYMAGFGENGVIFPVGDASALANIILDLERDRRRLALLSQKCQARFQTDFTAEAMTRQVESLYQKLINESL